MKAIDTLPEGYEEIFSVDLQNNKKMALIVNLSAIIIAVLMAIPAAIIVPISHLFSMDGGITVYFLKFVCLLICTVLYMVLHELVHGVAMKICGTRKVKYGFTGLYAFAGSDDYYSKGRYIFIALAPVVLWGIVIGVVNALLPVGWFWVAYIIQIVNLSGAAGDFYVTLKFLRFPRDILVKDYGVKMTVYSKSLK